MINFQGFFFCISLGMSKRREKAYIKLKDYQRNVLKNFKYKISPSLVLIFFIVMGFVAGVVYVAFCQDNRLLENEFLEQNFLIQVKEMTLDNRALFFLCLRKRLRFFLLLFLLAFSTVNILANGIFFLLQGFYIGAVMEIFLVRYGWQGLWVYLLLILPQGIFYGLGFFCLGCWCFRMEQGVGVSIHKKIGKLERIRDKKKLFAAFCMVFVGILLESYVHPLLLSLFFH